MHDWITELKEVLKKTLGKELVMPKRKMKKINNLEDFFTLFPEAKEIWIDGSERPTRRPKDKKKQKKQYSGKKKRHTKKNLIVSDKKKRILVVTKTVVGKKHDYDLFKREKLAQGIPKEIKTWLDTGFQGVKKDFPNLKVSMPKRASRGHPLTEKDKIKNKKVSKKRVLVENAICGIKRLRCLTDVCRNIKENFADDFIMLGAGLWNYHLKTS